MVAATAFRGILSCVARTGLPHGGRRHAARLGGSGRIRDSEIGPPEEDNAGHQEDQGHQGRQALEHHGHGPAECAAGKRLNEVADSEVFNHLSDRACVRLIPI